MAVEKWIANIVEQLLDKDLFLVDVMVKGKKIGQKVIVLVDGDNGISIGQCAEISRALSHELDQSEIIEGSYHLEVSSPGLDHPIKLPRQFAKNIGRTLEIDTGESKVTGKLIESGRDIEIEVKNKHKTDRIKIPVKDIKKANVLVSFK